MGRQQLLIYARELGGYYRGDQDLRHLLSQREQHIREMAAASIIAQEDERQWIAYEVHDRIAQTLASVFQQLQTLESMTREDPAARQVAVRASVLLREAIRESRNIMNDLHPPVLDEFGVEPLIREELRHFREELGCRIRYTAGYSVRPPKDMEVALYRIFHEALINIRRHASSARNVGVTLTSHRDNVDLQVQDDGPGFDIETALQRKRVGGLMSMRRRAEIIGGTLEVVSSPGSGTTVRVVVPLNGGK
jgi:signal transduction histidine kinase